MAKTIISAIGQSLTLIIKMNIKNIKNLISIKFKPKGNDLILNKIIRFIKDIPVNVQASKLVKKFPQFKQSEIVDILKTIKENRLECKGLNI